ncbi:leucine efflux protein LeuE [Actinocorallia sp. A-T 12471]|uniref:leucine efflux protein LeuE n=1 Tax=Actinocorallia sp. A-T 12471 TaxID=3089813 RepID=UPI0029D1FDC6|nr:leucine efflux protein LeuE [Actinocorallia sp. A-T 12471]MDX6741393.1 leucine efflux protein LeuE [Actinocorallia sp. A-T 12471]
MFGVTDIAGYALGAFLIVLLPGPNSLFTLSVAARDGVRGGYRAAGGVFVGDLVLMVASAAGVASLLRANPTVFAVVKYFGGAYLLWLAVGMLRAAWGMWRERNAEERNTDVVAEATSARAPEGNPFRKALLISLLNPKAILFFISFFVQFVDPAYPAPVLSFLVLAVILQVFSGAYLSLLIFGGTRLAEAFRRRKRVSATATSAVGIGFLGFAAKLLTASA